MQVAVALSPFMETPWPAPDNRKLRGIVRREGPVRREGQGGQRLGVQRRPQGAGQVRATWYYTWATNHDGIATPTGVSFVPMIWGPGSVTAASLSQAQQHGHVLLGFNEPDLSSQSNMTVASALNLWPQLMATGMRLGSPAVAFGGDTPGGWLDQFMSGAAARHYRVNFITLHWYGGNFATAPAVSELKTYLQAVRARYHKPIWLTEYALARFGATTVVPTPGRQAAFVRASTAMLRKLPYVWRYAWFALPASSSGPSTGLFRDGAVPTAVGRAFEKVPS
jgi:hypothetical protein